MNRPEIDTSSGLWRQRYEGLRLYFLEGPRTLEADPLGLVLFLRLGVAGWMKYWAAAPAASEAPAPLTQSFQPVMLTTEWQSQLTALLAQMAARHLPASLGL